MVGFISVCSYYSFHLTHQLSIKTLVEYFLEEPKIIEDCGP